MPSEPSRAARRKKRGFRRFLLGLLCIPPLLLGLGNLALATPWMKSRLAARLAKRSGLEAHIGSASWTPWGGAFIGDLRLLQPPQLRAALDRPVLEVRGIRVFPRWKPLLKGDLQVAEIRIDRPRGAVAFEMLASLAGGGSPPSVVPSTPVAGEPAVADSLPPPVTGPPAPASLSGAPPPLPAIPAGARGTTWIEITDADLDFFLGGNKIGGLVKFTGRIPCGGDPAESRCGLAGVTLFDRDLGRLALPVSWAGPTLRIGPGDIELAGIKGQVEMIIGRLPGVPFQVELRTPPQALDLSPVFPSLNPKAARFGAAFSARGTLSAPMGWEGLAASEASGISLALGQPLEFQEASIKLMLGGGTLNCPDARLIGETASFLGNGTLRASGEATAIVRAIVLPETAQAWSSRMAPAGAATAPVFSRMDTPGRVFIDLRWVSYPGGHGIEFGPGGPVLTVPQAARVFMGP